MGDDLVTIEWDTPPSGSREPATRIARPIFGPSTITPGRVILIALALSILVSGAAFAVSLWSRTADTSLFPIGEARDLIAAGVSHFPKYEAYIVATDSGLIGLRARSTHRGTPLPFCRTSGWFEDPYHGSKWDREGYYITGPAPRALDRLRIVLRGDTVFLDPTVVTRGPPRGPSTGQRPEGPFCVASAEVDHGVSTG